jgi:ATP-dependent RNA helicase RhlE
LPILQQLLEDRKELTPKCCRVLVLSPTRELALQIADSFKTYGVGKALQVAAIYGGTKYQPQYKALAQGLDVLVATPGRLMDHLEQRTVDLRNVDFFVLDEADQMMDMGFIKSIRQLAAKLKKERQNLFFSATMPKEIQSLVAELLTNPKKVEVKPESTTAERVEQQVIFIEQARKRALLSEMFADDKLSRALVFSRTKHGADKVTAYLQACGVASAVIHGEKSQGQRERALMAFKDGRIRALVATDIAARGIDVDNVTHVINFDLPMTPEAYVHRIGRTARAGQTGLAISLCANDERNKLKDIQRIIRMTLPTFDRRNDKALGLMDEAINAQGIGSKPETPERVKTARHIDPDAERGPRRARNRPERGERSERPRSEGRSSEGRGQGGRPKRYDNAVADVFKDDSAFAEHDRVSSAPTEGASFKRRPKAEGRPEGRGFEGRSERSFDDRPARSERPREDRPAYDKPRGDFKRPERSERPRSDRPSFGDRSDRPKFDNREKPAYAGRDSRRDDRGSSRSDERPVKTYDPMAVERAPAAKSFGKKPFKQDDGFGSRGPKPAKSYGEKRPFDRPRGEKPSFGGRDGGDRPRFDAPRPARPEGKPVHRKGAAPQRSHETKRIDDGGVQLKRRSR